MMKKELYSKDAPAVSVIVPAYNAASFITSALDSVLEQTFADYEIIVINDGSPDTKELEAVIDSYRDRITYLKQENRGASAARNAGLRAARGRFAAFLDSDDFWLPEYLVEQMAFIQGGKYDLVYSDAALFGNPRTDGKSFMQVNPSSGPVTLESLIAWDCLVITSCTLARLQPLVEVGLFDESILRCEDYDLWLRLAHRGYRIGYQRKVLAYHRQHGDSLASNKIRMLESRIEVLSKASRELGVTSAMDNLIAGQIGKCESRINLLQGKQHLVAGQYKEAERALERANRFSKSRKLQIALWFLRVMPKFLQRLYLTVRKKEMTARGKLACRKQTSPDGK